MDQADSLLDLIAVADLAPGKPASGTLQRVDKDSLEEFLTKCAPSVALGKFALTFATFRDFRPEQVAPKVAAAAALLRLRKEIGDLLAGRGSVETLKKELEGRPDLARTLEKTAPAAQKPVPPPPPSADPTAGIFALVDTGEPAPAPDDPPAEGMGRFFDAVVGASAGGRPSTAALKGLAATVDAALTEAVVQVMHAPSFRGLEASWRGLRYLVRSIDFRAGTRLHVLAAGHADVPRLLKEVVGPMAADLRSEGRLPCLLLDRQFDRSGEGIETVASLAETAASYMVPVIASVEADAPVDEEGWKLLRARTSTRWTALTSNRFLLRVPYGKDLDPVRSFDFEEPRDAPLWGNGCWIVGALLASSAARTGWTTDFAGREAAGDLEPHPLRSLTLRHGETVEIPLEADLSENAARSLGESGILALACRRNTDRVFAATAATLHDPPKNAPPASLRHTLFTARISMHLERLVAALDPSAEPAEMARALAAGLELLGMTDSAPLFTAEGKPSEEKGRPAISLRIRPKSGPLRGLPDLQIELPVPLR